MTNATEQPARRGFGQKRGDAAPNAKRTYPAEVLTSDEVDAMIARCSTRYSSGIRNRALLTLMYRSGLRLGEALSLRASDVNLDKHSIRLRATKSQKPQTRGFHPAADMPLLKWMERRKSLGLDVNGTPLFCTLYARPAEGVRAGEPLSDQYVRNMMKGLAAKAGIEKRVHPHILRHTFAAGCEEAGMTVTEISKALGHSSVAVTSRYLDHLTNEDMITALTAAPLPGTQEKPPSLEEEVEALRKQVAALTTAVASSEHRKSRANRGAR